MNAKPRTFLETYLHLTNWVRSRVFDSIDADVALSLARVYGDFRWMNHDGVYQDNELEIFVERMVLNSENYSPPDFSKKSAGTVLIASELYTNGGHSAVVLNWMRMFHDTGNHKLLITRSVTSKIEKLLINDRVPYCLCTNHGVRLVNDILHYTADAERIVLHVHPSDIVSVVAARILAQVGKSIVFYNHADHVFTYGISSAAIVCEVSNYGIALNNRTGRVKTSCYLGIPINFRENQTDVVPDEQVGRAKTVLSCGESTKYAPSNTFFGEFIDCLLLQEPNTIIVLVGPTGEESWWRGCVSRWGDSIQFKGGLDHNKYMEVMELADVYVDSFPITGGTAFPEALLNGKLVTGLQSPIQGYSPADELKVKNIELLTEQVIKLLKQDSVSVSHVADVRNKAESIHLISRFRERVLDIYSNNWGRWQGNDIPFDTYWIEKRWLQRQKIHFPFWSSFQELLPVYRLRFLLEIIKVLKFSEYSYIMKFFLCVIINPHGWFWKRGR